MKLILLLIVTALPLPQQAPADELRRIETAISNTPAITVNFSLQSTVVDLGDNCKGSLAIKGDAKVMIHVTSTVKGQLVVHQIKSNGARVVDSTKLYSSLSEKDLKTIKRHAVAMLARSGVSLLSPLIRELKLNKGLDEEQFARVFLVSDVKWEKGDNNVKCLSYLLGAKELELRPRIHVWFEPETYRILKRAIYLSSEIGEIVEPSVVELYSEWKMNAELPDSMFDP